MDQKISDQKWRCSAAFTGTGAIYGFDNEPFNISAVNYVRLQAENVGNTSVINVYGRFGSSSNYDLLCVMHNGLKYTVNTSHYDQLYFDVVVYDQSGADPAVIKGAGFHDGPERGVSEENSTVTPLLANATFTGTWVDVSTHAAITVACKADQDGALSIQFTQDGLTVDSSIDYDVPAGVNETHRLTSTRRFMRVVLQNGAVNQGSLKLQTMLGDFTALTSPLKSQIAQDADALVVRAVDTESSIAGGKFAGFEVVNKFGRNPSIDSGSAPEDIWNGGGLYTGFPTGAAEEFQVFSSSGSDTGVLTFTYLPSFTATEWLTATVTLNGTTPVNTGVTGVRMHTANYNSGSSTAFNVGTITVRHRTTTANVFCVMPIGRSQTNVAAYTVPFGHTGFIRRFFCRVYGGSGSQVTGGLWIRALNASPRIRRPFVAGTSDHFEELPYGGLQIPAGADIMVRVLTASANNLEVLGGFDILVVKN